MAIDIPEDWPPSGWREVPPLAHLETINGDAPSGTIPARWRVANWASTREIKSSALPGQVRHQSGLSVGTAKAVVKRQDQDFPWKRGLVFELTGQDAQILLAPEGKTEIPTGQFRVAEVSGDMTSVGVQVELDEAQIKGTDSAPGVLGEQWVSGYQIDDTYFDPVWLVEQLAQQLGYGVGVQPGEPLPSGVEYTPLLDVPFQGSMVPEFPERADYTEFAGAEAAFAELDDEGIVGLTPRTGASSAHVEYRLRQDLVSLTTWTFDLKGRARFGWKDADGTSVAWFRIWNRSDVFGSPETSITLQVGSTGSSGSTNGSSSGTATFPASEDRPSGVQVQFEVTPTTARARVRRGAGSTWSGWVTNAITNPLSATADYGIETYSDRVTTPTETYSVLSRLSVVNTGVDFGGDDVLLYGNVQGQNGRIYLEPLGGISVSPWLDPNLSVWSTMQAIVEAWQGALITDVYGNLRVLNRFSLVGAQGRTETPIDVGLRFEDLPWQMNYTDQADRLVVKYRPAVEKKALPTDTALPIIYEFQDVLRVDPGSNDFFFTLDYIYPVDLQVLDFVRKDSDDKVNHVWDAWRQVDGTGDHIAPNTQLNMRLDRVSSSTWKVYAQSLSGSRFFMVDSTGTPWLKIRSSFYFDQTVEQTIERGLSAGDSENALEVDLGHYVQNATDANVIADFLWGRVNRRTWRAATIVSIPDHRLDLGDVVDVFHERTGVRSNALVTKVDLAGEPGSVTQKLDLVLIPPTWEDFDEAWSGPDTTDTWTEFDNLWDAYTWDDFDRTPTATTVGEIEENM